MNEAFVLKPTDEKTEWRQRFRQARQSFAQKMSRKVSASLSRNLETLIADLGIAQVAGYAALKDEAPFEISTAFFYPCLRGDQMSFWCPREDHKFQTGPLGIAEPSPLKSTPLDPTQPMLICCPAVALDWQGQRLGMGKGYYDRFFSSHPNAIRVGVAFQIQVSKDPLPVDSWDQTLDWIVTEEMILRTSKMSP